MVVLEIEPNEDDQTLATTNGFAVAFPHDKDFHLVWPS